MPLEYAAHRYASHSGLPKCACQDLSIVRTLLDAGAKPRGDVLHSAMRAGNPALLLLLLDRGLVSAKEQADILDPNCPDYSGLQDHADYITNRLHVQKVRPTPRP